MWACKRRDHNKRRFTDVGFAAPMSECYLRPCANPSNNSFFSGWQSALSPSTRSLFIYYSTFTCKPPSYIKIALVNICYGIRYWSNFNKNFKYYLCYWSNVLSLYSCKVVNKTNTNQQIIIRMLMKCWTNYTDARDWFLDFKLWFVGAIRW